jgi:hypothetical protein
VYAPPISYMQQGRVSDKIPTVLFSLNTFCFVYEQ